MARVARGLGVSALLLAGISLAACASVGPTTAPSGRSAAPPSASGLRGTAKPYQIGGVWYVPREQPDYDEVGIGSWYGQTFHLRPTANGEVFDMNAMSAAHTTLPLPSIVEVTNLDNGRKLQVRVNDRGPFVSGRIIDLSREAARELGYEAKGVARVRVRYVGPAPARRPAGVSYAALASRPSAPSPRPPAPPAPPAPAPASPPQPAPQGFHVQAGAFSSPENARKAVSQLAPAGQAVIEPSERGGQTLYRVLLPAPGDEAGAHALRERVAGIGFIDARVVRTF